MAKPKPGQRKIRTTPRKSALAGSPQLFQSKPRASKGKSAADMNPFERLFNLGNILSGKK